MENDEKEDGENWKVDTEVWWEKVKELEEVGRWVYSGGKEEWGIGSGRSQGVEGKGSNGEEARGDGPHNNGDAGV